MVHTCEVAVRAKAADRRTTTVLSSSSIPRASSSAGSACSRPACSRHCTHCTRERASRTGRARDAARRERARMHACGVPPNRRLQTLHIASPFRDFPSPMRIGVPTYNCQELWCVLRTRSLFNSSVNADSHVTDWSTRSSTGARTRMYAHARAVRAP